MFTTKKWLKEIIVITLKDKTELGKEFHKTFFLTGSKKVVNSKLFGHTEFEHLNNSYHKSDNIEAPLSMTVIVGNSIFDQSVQ